MERRRVPKGPMASSALFVGGLLIGAPASAQFFVPEASSRGAGSYPSVRAAAVDPAEPTSTAPQVRLGPLGVPVGLPAGEPSVETRRFAFNPSVAVDLLATDNVFQTSRDRKADLITTIAPSIIMNVDTPRLTGLVNYAPRFLFYSRYGSENRIDQLFNGQMVATIIPDHFFVDLRGASGVQSLIGGQTAGTSTAANRGNQVQTTSFILSPYYVHRFGTLATARFGYSLQYSNQSLSDSNSVRNSSQQAARAGFADSEFTAHQVYGVVRTGPDFGRVALEGAVESTNYVGNGVLDGAYRRSATLEGRYAIRRDLFVLAEGGYEQQRYAGTPGFRVDGPIYSVGARLDLSDQSFIIARYGRRDGFDSPSLEASIALGGRTRLVARYDDRISVQSRRATDLLTTTTLDELGNPIDLATGLPALTTANSSFFGVQSSLFRVRSALASVVQTWERNTFSLNFVYEERSVVSVAPGTTPSGSNGFTTSFSWGRSLSERTTAVAFLQYGRISGSNFSNGDSVTASLSFQHQLQPRLLATLQLASSNRTTGDGSGSGSGRVLQNIVLVGLRQSF